MGQILYEESSVNKHESCFFWCAGVQLPFMLRLLLETSSVTPDESTALSSRGGLSLSYDVPTVVLRSAAAFLKTRIFWTELPMPP